MDTQHTIHWKSIIMVTTSVLIVAAFAGWWYLNGLQAVNDFDSCLEARGEVQETFPRRCVYQGATYVEEIASEDNRAASNEQIMMVIAEERGPCSDNEADRCLYAGGEPVNEPIQGFEYQEGNLYKIIVDKVANENNIRNPFTYKLNQVVSITRVFTPDQEDIQTGQRIYADQPVPEQVAEPTPEFEPRVVNTRRVTIAPYLVDCDTISDQPCYLLDNEPFGQKIEDFEYQSGVSYIIELEVIQNYPETQAEEREDPLYTYRLRSIIEPQAEETASTSTTTVSSSSTTQRAEIKLQEE